MALFPREKIFPGRRAGSAEEAQRKKMRRLELSRTLYCCWGAWTPGSRVQAPRCLCYTALALQLSQIQCLVFLHLHAGSPQWGFEPCRPRVAGSPQ